MWTPLVIGSSAIFEAASGPRDSSAPPLALAAYNPLTLMALQVGHRLGSYEVVGLLGVGGMGEVYRARDPRLQRDVALKVLPDIAAADPDRRERFRREALAVAALNHPHIVTIHSVEEAGTTVFLTMELVEGRSLAEVLPSGGLTLDRLLTVAIAVADAMSAAHQKGITHRDLKPANIMLGEGEQRGTHQGARLRPGKSRRAAARRARRVDGPHRGRRTGRADG